MLKMVFVSLVFYCFYIITAIEVGIKKCPNSCPMSCPIGQVPCGPRNDPSGCPAPPMCVTDFAICPM